MAWIKFEKDLLTDPRVLRVARSLQTRLMVFDREDSRHGDQYDASNAVALPAVTLVCGALVRIWSLADTHLDEQDVLPLGINELDEVVGIPGFCALLPKDWLDVVDEHTVKLPEFHAHNGTEAKKRAVTQKRVARYRSSVTDRNAQALPDQTRPDKTRPKGKEARTPKKPPLGEDTLTALGVDEQAAKDWLAVRKAKKAPLTETALDDLKREAGKAGITVAEAVAICARRSWQGFNASWNWRDGSNAGNKQANLEAHNAAVAEEFLRERHAA